MTPTRITKFRWGRMPVPSTAVSVRALSTMNHSCRQPRPDRQRTENRAMTWQLSVTARSRADAVAQANASSARP